MGLFDSIRRVVGGGQSDTETESATEDDPPELVDASDLDVADLRERAEDVAGEVDQLDFSLASLEQFDAAIEAGYDDELHTAEAAETYDRDVVRFGCYLGEVLVRVYDGEWTHEDGWGVTITGPDDEVTVSVFEVALRSIQTDPVFAAVTERAAAEVGLDGTVDPTAVPDVPETPTTDDDAADDEAEGEEAAAGDAVPDDEATDDGVTNDAASDDEATGDGAAADETPADDVATDGATDDQTASDAAVTETTADEGVTADDEAGTTTDRTASEETGADPTVDDGTDADDPATPVDDTPADDSGTTQAAEVPSGPEDVGTGEDIGFEFGSGEGAEATRTPSQSDGAETDDSERDTERPEADDSAPDEASPEDILADAGELNPDDGSTDDTLTDTDGTSADETTAAPAGPEAAETDRSDADDTSDGEYTNPFEAATTQTSTDEGDPDAESDTDDEEGVSELVDEAEPDRESDDGGDSLFDDDAAADGTTAQSAPTADAGEMDPTEFDGLRAEYAEEAAGFVDFWSERDLDYTPASLERLDALVAAEWDDDRFDDATFGSDETFDDRAFTSVATELGSYFGEVLIRELDAEWSDETATDSVIVESPDGPLAIPVFRVAGTSLRQAPVFAKSYESLLEDIDG